MWLYWLNIHGRWLGGHELLRSGWLWIVALLHGAWITYDSQHRGRFNILLWIKWPDGIKFTFKICWRELWIIYTLTPTMYIYLASLVYVSNRFGMVLMMLGRGSKKLAVQEIKKKQRTLLKNIRRNLQNPSTLFWMVWIEGNCRCFQD